MKTVYVRKPKAEWDKLVRDRGALLQACLSAQDLLRELESGGAENPELAILTSAIASAKANA